MNTIDYTPPPTIRDFILDYKPGAFFADWIIGPVGCLPADSEFLTPTGWKRMDAYAPGDLVAVYKDGSVSFEAAEYVKLLATEPFYRFDSGSLEMELSPEHRVLYTDYRGVQQVATAAECAAHPSRRTIPTTWTLDRHSTAMSEDEIRLRVAFSADGHIPHRGKQVFVVVRKERKKERLRELLTACQIEWKETTYAQRPTETRFSFCWPSADKSLAFVWELSTAQLEIVLDECLRWDGLNDHAEKRYYTTVPEHADAIQFAAHSCGLRATIKLTDQDVDSWKQNYVVHIRASDNAKNRAMVRAETRITRFEPVDGFKYCFTTSTGFFIARCNRTVFVTGNSGKTTGIFFKLVRMASMQAKGPDGIRRTRAVIVRNTLPQLKDTTLVSWNYWFKDGQAGTWRATENKFQLKFGDVECEVLFRPLDTADDVARVLSLEVTFAIFDEFVEIPREIIEAVAARCGRFPSKKDGGATNWGMWGSSNPSTEDNWWFEYLHTELPKHSQYFKQPSGFSEEAENVENLPGGRDYYVQQTEGKSQAWVKQFIESEWGFSIAGKPVVPTFNPELHLAKNGLLFNPHLDLVVGLDPGISGSALIFGQEDHHGRLLVLGELVQQGYGAERLIQERMKPYVRQRFPEAKIIIAPDPASANRGQTNEKSVVDVFRRHYPVKVESNNRLPLRLDAIEHFSTRLTGMGPALLVDAKECPGLVRALRGGWRFAMDTKRDTIKGADPEKNSHSHVGDSFGYLCRYFHKLNDREMRYQGKSAKPFVARQQFTNAYHVR